MIPGHGRDQQSRAENLSRQRREAEDRAQSLIREGKSQDELAKAMTAEYGWAANSLQQQWSVPGMMKELK